jgi:hypothetical protein
MLENESMKLRLRDQFTIFTTVIFVLVLCCSYASANSYLRGISLRALCHLCATRNSPYLLSSSLSHTYVNHAPLRMRNKHNNK